jgi:hypothetical protein
MMAAYFCDSLKEVTLLNGVVRLEFQRLEGTGMRGSERDLLAQTEFVIAMPAQGFVHALGLLDQVRDGLIKDGVMRPVASEINGEMPPIPQRKSPNFT